MNPDDFVTHPKGFADPAPSLDGKRLYDPKHFHWLGVLFSGLVPIAMAAANWGQVGEGRKRLLWLLLGVAGYTTLFLVLFPEPGTFTFIAMGLNAGVAFFLRDRQRALFDAARERGARVRPAWQGIGSGLGLLLISLAVPFLVFVSAHQGRFDRAVRLVDEGRISEAATLFERILREDAEDPSVVFNLGMCRLVQAQWPEAARHLERSLALAGGDSAVTYMDLAIARAAQGRRADADSLAELARLRQPGIFVSHFDSDDVAMIADSISRNPSH